jgi:hypothetical protein
MDVFLELFCNPVTPVVQGCDGIAFREEVADQPLAPKESFCGGRGDRHDLIPRSPAHVPEMEIVRDRLVGIGVEVEILSLSLDLGSIFFWSRGRIEAFVMPCINRYLPAAIIQLCFHQISSSQSRDRFPRRSWLPHFNILTITLSKVRVLPGYKRYPCFGYRNLSFLKFCKFVAISK